MIDDKKIHQGSHLDSLALLLLVLAGCALDVHGTGPSSADLQIIEASTTANDAGAPARVEASPAVVEPTPEAASPTFDAAPPAIEASPGNIFGRPANPDAFKACQTTCPTGCCDPAGICWITAAAVGPLDSACGIGGTACVDCTAYQAHCGKDGICQ